jgi:ribose-phosphate pyrophosphokinase
MISIGQDEIDIGNFPDGSILVKYQDSLFNTFFPTTITWRYENDREFLCLIYLVKHLQSHGVREIYLNMPYIPNARQDRVKNREDVFTLKYFAEILNSLNLTEVSVLDPHSSVSEALINNIHVRKPDDYILTAIDRIDPWGGNNIMLFYPDSGAAKRYSESFKTPYAFGIKKRDWKTGKIEGLDVAGEVDKIAGKDVLIVDDICSRGGTFYHSAKKLKEHGAKDIYLFVSHCENTILEGELLEGDLIKKVYTTDSIFTKSHEKVEVLK